MPKYNRGSLDSSMYSQSLKRWRSGYVYIIDYGNGETFKIGYTAGDPEVRFKQIARSTSSVILPMHLVMAVYTDTDPRSLENLIQMSYDYTHKGGEWFNLEFSELVDIHQVFKFFGAVELYDRWFEIVPEDYQGYIDHYAINPKYPYFTVEEREAARSFKFPDLEIPDDFFLKLGEENGN